MIDVQHRKIVKRKSDILKKAHRNKTLNFREKSKIQKQKKSANNVILKPKLKRQDFIDNYILEENFIKDNDGKWYVPDPENEADLEKLFGDEQC